jgi:hypothetical protein
MGMVEVIYAQQEAKVRLADAARATDQGNHFSFLALWIE